MFIKYLEEWVGNNADRLTTENIKLEHALNYEGEKIELGLSNTINNNGGSVELLKDGTCDSMIISYETDETLFYETVVFTNTDELSKYLNDFVIRLAQD
jgi:hypothetical protein